MGWTVLYIAFGIVALWLLGEVLLQYKARLRWRLLAFFGFLGVVLGVLLPSVAVIALGTVAFAAGQTFVTLSFRRGFSTGWALGGRPGTSRRRRGSDGGMRPLAPVTDADGAPPEPPADGPTGEPPSSGPSTEEIRPEDGPEPRSAGYESPYGEPYGEEEYGAPPHAPYAGSYPEGYPESAPGGAPDSYADAYERPDAYEGYGTGERYAGYPEYGRHPGGYEGYDGSERYGEYGDFADQSGYGAQQAPQGASPGGYPGPGGYGEAQPDPLYGESPHAPAYAASEAAQAAAGGAYGEYVDPYAGGTPGGAGEQGGYLGGYAAEPHGARWPAGDAYPGEAPTGAWVPHQRDGEGPAGSYGYPQPNQPGDYPAPGTGPGYEASAQGYYYDEQQYYWGRTDS